MQKIIVIDTFSVGTGRAFAGFKDIASEDVILLINCKENDRSALVRSIVARHPGKYPEIRALHTNRTGRHRLISQYHNIAQEFGKDAIYLIVSDLEAHSKYFDGLVKGGQIVMHAGVLSQCLTSFAAKYPDKLLSLVCAGDRGFDATVKAHQRCLEECRQLEKENNLMDTKDINDLHRVALSAVRFAGDFNEVYTNLLWFNGRPSLAISHFCSIVQNT